MSQFSRVYINVLEIISVYERPSHVLSLAQQTFVILLSIIMYKSSYSAFHIVFLKTVLTGQSGRVRVVGLVFQRKLLINESRRLGFQEV
jgi:hypothetical protein